MIPNHVMDDYDDDERHSRPKSRKKKKRRLISLKRVREKEGFTSAAVGLLPGVESEGLPTTTKKNTASHYFSAPAEYST